MRQLNDTLAAFANDGMSRSETNSAAAYGPLVSHLAPRRFLSY